MWCAVPRRWARWVERRTPLGTTGDLRSRWPNQEGGAGDDPKDPDDLVAAWTDRDLADAPAEDSG